MKEADSSEKLFAEFPPITKEQWKEKALADLKGGDFDKKLVWRTFEEIDLQPFYTKDDLKSLDYLKRFQHCALNNSDPAKGPAAWSNIERIAVEEVATANKTAIEALANGADGLLFDLAGKEHIDIGKLLNNILPLHCSVSFIADRNAAKLIKGYFTYESVNHIETARLKGSLNYDPIKNFALKGEMASDGFDILREIIEITEDAANFYGITINGKHFLDAGASLVQELAFSLSVAVEYIDRLTDLGLLPEQVMKNMAFSMGIGTDYFPQIAKLRALRVLFYKIAETYGFTDFHPGDLHIHSVSSAWTKTIYDPYVNMLRNTTEAMSAILGGCNALTIAPYDEHFETPTPFSKRISRNISAILKEESFFDKVADPGAGSYYIESITDKIIEKSWELFREIESEGGFMHGFRSGMIQERIRQTRDTKLERIAQRREVYVGTNKYPNTNEQLDPDEIYKENFDKENMELLVPVNGAVEFEQMRLKTDAYSKRTGRRPMVYLALIGDNPAMRTARAQFSGGFFGCGGFGVIEGEVTENVKETVKKALEHNAEITVICGADEDYPVLGVRFARHFRESRKDGLLIVAGNPKDAIEDLITAGIDDFIHIRTNLLDALTDFQDKLNIN